jgi:hypothetical protein
VFLGKVPKFGMEELGESSTKAIEATHPEIFFPKQLSTGGGGFPKNFFLVGQNIFGRAKQATPPPPHRNTEVTTLVIVQANQQEH